MSEDNDILKELESIVNDAHEQIHSEWRDHSRQMLNSMNSHVDAIGELDSHESCAVVGVISHVGYDRYDAERIVGPNKPDDADAQLASVNHIITLEQASDVPLFFGDQGVMIIAQDIHNHVGFFVRVKHKSGRKVSYLVLPNWFAVSVNDTVHLWEYTEEDHADCKRTLTPTQFEYLSAIVIGMNGPRIMRKEMPAVFDAMVQEFRKRHEEHDDDN